MLQLDIAEFTSSKIKTTQSRLLLTTKQDATNTEVQTLKLYLQQWCKIQNFETKMFHFT